MARVSYDSEGRRYEVAPIRFSRLLGSSITDPIENNNVHLANAWRYNRHPVEGSNQYHLYSHNCYRDFVIRQIIDPLGATASYDILDFSYALIDENGHCAEMPHHPPTLHYSLPDKIIDQAGNNKRPDVPDYDVTSTTSWHSAGNHFVVPGRDVPSPNCISITQNAGGTWDTYYSRDFELIDV
jgi:hypothetical protein